MVAKFAGMLFAGSIMTGSLLGCQPNTNTVDSEAGSADHAEHSQEEHAEHDSHEGHGDHADDEEHAEHKDHANHDDHAEHEGHDHSAHADSGMSFSCEPTTTIGVSYHDDVSPKMAHLLIDGLEYELSAVSDNGAADQQTYVSEIGLDETHGIVWQADGDSAVLRNKTLDSEVNIEAEDVIFNCQKS